MPQASGSTIDFSQYATPEQSQQIDFSKYAQSDQGSQEAPSIQLSPTPTPSPGFIARFAQSFGLPSSREEFEQLKNAPQPGTHWYDAILPPGVTQLGGMAKSYYQTAKKGAQEGAQEVTEAINNIGAGGPTLPNIGKAAHGVAHASMQAVPLIGPTVENFGTDIHTGNYGGAAGGAAGLATQAVLQKVGSKAGTAAGDIASTAEPHEILASTLTRNPKINIVGDSEAALPILKESAADIGKSPVKPNQFVVTVDNAGRIIQDRVESLAEPLRQDVLPRQLVEGSGEHAQLTEMLGSKPVTLGRLMDKIADWNKELRRANYYALDPSAQFASKLGDTAAAVSQARRVLYDYLGEQTGVNVQPMRQQQAAIYRILDNAKVTANQIAQDSATFKASSRIGRAAKTAKAIASVGTLGNIPTDPMTEFAGKMQQVFGDVGQSAANRTLTSPEGFIRPVPPTPPPIPGQPLRLNAGVYTGQPSTYMPPGLPTHIFEGEYLPMEAPTPPPAVRGALPSGQYAVGPSTAPPTSRALPPIRLPEQMAIPSNRVEAVGMPQTAEGEAIQQRFNRNSLATRDSIVQAMKEGRISPGEGDRRLRMLGESTKIKRPTPPR